MIEFWEFLLDQLKKGINSVLLIQIMDGVRLYHLIIFITLIIIVLIFLRSEGGK